MTDEERAFKAGWHHGDYDASDHDCRMFVPTAERAWEEFKRGNLVQVWSPTARTFVDCVPPKQEPDVRHLTPKEDRTVWAFYRRFTKDSRPYTEQYAVLENTTDHLIKVAKWVADAPQVETVARERWYPTSDHQRALLRLATQIASGLADGASMAALLAQWNVTHYVQHDSPIVHRPDVRAALCGELVAERVQHDNTPSCQACRDLLAQWEAMTV